METNDENNNSISVIIPPDIHKQIELAAGYFWLTRGSQARNQGKNGLKDQGGRRAVTGGKQMVGFENLIKELLILNGVPVNSIFTDRAVELPGYFRPSKKWDLVVVHNNTLLVVIEMKSQVGPSFGNNFNNRAEEAIGSATDIWTAYRENAFGNIRRPWLGYLFMLENSDKSSSPTHIAEPHFSIFPEFHNASYIKRYTELCFRLVREQLYTETSLLLSKSGDVTGETVKEASQDLGLLPFLQSLLFSVKLGLKQEK